MAKTNTNNKNDLQKKSKCSLYLSLNVSKAHSRVFIPVFLGLLLCNLIFREVFYHWESRSIYFIDKGLLWGIQRRITENIDSTWRNNK